MRRAAVERWTTGAAVEQGLDLAAQVSATASEALRTRREPAAVARRRQRAARRRVRSWSAASAATVAAGAGVVAIGGGLSTGVIVGLILLAALLTFCVARAVRAVVDLRARTRVVEALPPPSPRRSAVVAELRPMMSRLDGYSDGLRPLVAMIGLLRDDPSVRALRDDVIAAADATEQRLRLRAGDASELIRARRRAAVEVSDELDASIAALRREIDDGVAAYGRLVAAANDAAAATRALSGGAGALSAGSGAPSAASGALSAGSGARSPGGGGSGPTGNVDRVLSDSDRASGGAPASHGDRASGSDRASGGAPASVGDRPSPEAGAPELAEPTERLLSLAAGMREITR